jgi:histidinol phosphatase-like PHP family hydrolase
VRDSAAFRLLVIADAHCATSPAEVSPEHESRRSLLGSELLTRAIESARQTGGFDAIALLGDLLNDGAQPQSDATLDAVAKQIRDQAGDVPLLIVPGNHDGDATRLMRAFNQQPGGRRLGPYRFYTFADSYAEGDACTRPADQQAAFLAWAAAETGPIIVLQHNPMNPAIECDYPFMLTNRSLVMADYSRAGVALSLSGHYHAGQVLNVAGGVSYFTAAALCEEPFRFAVLTLRGREVAVENLQLMADPLLALVDCHAHTEFAYCGQGISAEATIERSRTFGLAGVCLVEHAPQLYCSADDFWNARHIHQPALWRAGANSRADQFRSVMEPRRTDFVRIGLEVELDADGQLTLREEDQWIDLVVGAIHWLAEDPAGLTDAQLAAAFMQTCEGLLRGGIDILAHPWRVFAWVKRPVPTELYPVLADALAAAGVAAEINCHKNVSDPAFFAECIARGVKISFGSDAHQTHQAGNLLPHLAILQQAAGTTDPQVLRELMFRP